MDAAKLAIRCVWAAGFPLIRILRCGWMRLCSRIRLWAFCAALLRFSGIRILCGESRSGAAETFIYAAGLDGRALLG